MSVEILMPRLSDSMEEGTILTWIKSVGDRVALGEELVEIETDKANMVFEADAAGTLIEIVAAEGDTLPIGEVIARVGEAGETPPTESAEDEADDRERGDPRVHVADAPPAASAPSSVEPTSPPGDGRVKASPLARRIAGERGVDLGAIAGSGPGGRIIKADVVGAAGAPAARTPAPAAAVAAAPQTPATAKGTVSVIELSKLQQTVSRRMAESKATAPHFYLQAEIEMSRCFAARSQIKASAAEDEVVPSFNDMVVKAAAIALGEFPRANGAYRDGHWELYSRINIGIAVAARDALVVPTIFDANQKGLRQIASESRALAAKVRDGAITPPELSGGTFTVSNLGMYGVSNFGAVINSPQAAILAVGQITETPVAREGEITTAQIMGVTLACDHRILYGAEGAEFLARVRALLEEPLGLAL